jgi:serine/threonine protein kinase
MNGGDLRFHISRKSFTDEAVRFWMAELGCALRYIHTQGIVHRDVKPDNILLDSEGHVHLADFVSVLWSSTALHMLMVARMLHLISDLANNLLAGLEHSPTWLQKFLRESATRVKSTGGHWV